MPLRLTARTLEAQIEIRRTVTITPTQKLVLDQLVRDGADNATIARRLGMARGTATSHVKELLRRLGVSNRAAIVAEVLQGRVRIEVDTQQRRTKK